MNISKTYRTQPLILISLRVSGFFAFSHSFLHSRLDKAATNISKEITATVKNAYGQKIKVFDTEIPHSIRAVEATAEGKSIFAYDKSGKIAAAYEQFGKEVAELGEKQRSQNRADRLR